MYTNDRNFTIWYQTFCYIMFLLNKVNQVRVTIWEGCKCDNVSNDYIHKKKK